MVMTLKRLVRWLRDGIRSFLGIDVLPTRLETIQIRDDLAKYHREVMESFVRISVTRRPEPFIDNYQPATLSWEMVQRIELQNMLQNPPKED